MKLKITLLLMIALLFVAATDVNAQNAAAVKKFIEAFNAHDIGAMLALADPEIEWRSIAGEKNDAETKGKEALQKSLEKYWKGCNFCRSKIVWLKESKERVVVLEEASWKFARDKASTSQQSVSVYEFRAGKILRVYYFPVEK